LNALSEIAKKHNDWMNIVLSFGCDPDIAEDLVQEMYLKIDSLIKRGIDITYKDEINYFYIYKTLKSLFLDLKRKETKYKKISLDSDYIKDIHTILEKYSQNKEAGKQIDIVIKMKKLNEILDNLYWYDRKIFDLISNGMSIQELSNQTKISYYSLYNTYRNVKKHIKKNLQWD
tara:strand:- start:1079 stop:1600 length:522 start_codon:yes stop_codon:yes gene_type:complete